MKAPIIPIIIVVVVVGLAAYYFSGYTPTAPRAIATAESVTGLEVAERALSFVEGTRIEDGTLLSMLQCAPGTGDECEEFVADSAIESDLLSAAYDDMYEATGDQRYLRLSEEEFGRVMEICSPYDVCGIGGFSSVLEAYRKSPTDELKQILIGSEASWVELSEVEGDLPLLAAIRLAQIYSVSGDQGTLAKAEELLTEAKGGAASDEFNVVLYPTQMRKYDCMKQTANLEFYKYTGDQKYLDGALAFFESNDVAGNAPYLLETRTGIDCAEALLSLSDRDAAVVIASEVIRNSWDTPELPRLHSNYGFVAGNQFYYKQNVVDSIRMVSLLAKLKDAEFEAPRARSG